MLLMYYDEVASYVMSSGILLSVTLPLVSVALPLLSVTVPLLSLSLTVVACTFRELFAQLAEGKVLFAKILSRFVLKL